MYGCSTGKLIDIAVKLQVAGQLAFIPSGGYSRLLPEQIFIACL